MGLSDKDKAFLEHYAAQVAAFRKFCIQNGGDVMFEETNFTDLSLGFFIALGVGNEVALKVYPDDLEEMQSNPHSDASFLATICRYQCQYWEGETL